VLDDGEQRKLTLNQVLLREVNEQIRSLSTSFGETGTISVVCECARDGCMVLLPVSVEDYEAVRHIPTRFFLAEGHEIAGVETVVEETPDYIVVEKTGASAPVAIRMDPRSHHTEVPWGIDE